MKRAKRLKTKGIYFLYRLIQALALPFLLFYFLWRGARNRAYFGSIRQRFGFLPRSYRQTTPGAIWLHAVSVGEVIASIELVRLLRDRLPRALVFVSVSTLAGRAAAEDKLAPLAAGVFYAPADYVFAVRRVLRALQPSVVLVAETEIWPNLFRETRRTEAALLLINARISDRALPRYTRLRALFCHVLRHADAVLAQSEAMRARFVAAGAPPGIVSVAGNLKYDFQPREALPDSPARALLEQLAPAQVWIAASTMPPAGPGDPDEDDAVIEAFERLAPAHPDLALLLAPRRPERFDVAARKLHVRDIPFVRRSRSVAAKGRVILLDTIGELSSLFSLGDVVFMGGSLASRGGHNILEPAFFGCPIVVGPHMENFQAIADEFRAAGALVEVAGAESLAAAVGALLDDRARAREVGDRARACALANRGAATRTLERIAAAHDAALPVRRPAQPWAALVWPYERLWMWGGRRRLARNLARRRRLSAPVISFGNITLGGTGKTPLVLYLAEQLRDAGHRPGILTRGYGRKSPEKHVALAPGATMPVDRSGDEPQIFLRAGVAAVGIGPDRFLTGRMLEQFGCDVILLDDGFQHVRLVRSADLVLIDGLNPFGGGRVFPGGRLREPLTSLARADLFLITRSDFARSLPAIERRLREHNPGAPVFHSRAVPLAWIEHATGARLPLDALPSARVAAFCGLGNPESFWHTLRAMHIEPLDRVEFNDHHSYSPKELLRLADVFRSSGAEIALTTGKDALNLCDDCDTLMAPLRIYWLDIGVHVDRPRELMAAIKERLAVLGKR